MAMAYLCIVSAIDTLPVSSSGIGGSVYVAGYSRLPHHVRGRNADYLTHVQIEVSNPGIAVLDRTAVVLRVPVAYTGEYYPA